MRGGKRRPTPVEERLDWAGIQDVVRQREEARVKLEEMQDKPRCPCGLGVVSLRPDGVPLPCPGTKCPTRASPVDVQILSVETSGGRLTYFRRGGRVPGGAPLFWWEPDDTPAKVG